MKRNVISTTGILELFLLVPALFLVTKPVMARPHAGMVDLGTLGGTYSTAVDINDKGQVTGTSSIVEERAHAFLWTERTGMVDLGYLGDRGSYAAEINNKGQVVGYSWVALGREHAFLWTKNNGMVDLGTLDTLGGPPEATVSRAVGINDKGQVIGWSAFGTIEHAFLWTKENGMIDLGTLGGTYSTAVDINNKGQVIGNSNTASGEKHAFLWTAR